MLLTSRCLIILSTSNLGKYVLVDAAYFRGDHDAVQIAFFDNIIKRTAHHSNHTYKTQNCHQEDHSIVVVAVQLVVESYPLRTNIVDSHSFSFMICDPLSRLSTSTGSVSAKVILIRI
jgi:hypothetical protein